MDQGLLREINQMILKLKKYRELNQIRSTLECTKEYMGLKSSSGEIIIHCIMSNLDIHNTGQKTTVRQVQLTTLDMELTDRHLIRRYLSDIARLMIFPESR